MWKLQEIKDNAVHKSLLKVFKGQRILFLENGDYMDDCVGNFHIWVRENKIEHNTLFDIRKLDMEYIKNQINNFDVIAFQTTWTYEVSHKLSEYIQKLKDKKIVVECYIKEPTWFYKPKGVVHDVYVLHSDEDMDTWEFNKLRINKPIWEK
jgi:hypothetical protein